jgi:ankyrin repeat protein
VGCKDGFITGAAELSSTGEASTSSSLEPLKRFLAAGGQPETLVELPSDDETPSLAPLIRRAIMTHQIAHDPAMHHASLELLLQAGANVNAICKDANGLEHTSLMAACRGSCCIAPVRILLAHGADPALQTSTGDTALHIAARAGRLECCKVLLQAAGCEPDVRSSKGFTPLALAVHEGHVRVVELLHKQWGVNNFNRLPDGATMLHLAAASGLTLVLEHLLRNGLDINATTGEVLTSVMIAAKRATLKLCRCC